ncbi:MAG: hypothetical protein LBJ15_00830 [Comamonas sp.]|jgi:hypothetical protein|uniref:hypothetical protein n=1 Tax=Comamonas sp. TaxID=34028 RepID=UPI0028233C7D|nr:hypothetical protein [Comamonas sp.]MDR0212531.1 hypothetical protein [Comamonas sp.]
MNKVVIYTSLYEPIGDVYLDQTEINNDDVIQIDVTLRKSMLGFQTVVSTSEPDKLIRCDIRCKKINIDGTEMTMLRIENKELEDRAVIDIQQRELIVQAIQQRHMAAQAI